MPDPGSPGWGRPDRVGMWTPGAAGTAARASVADPRGARDPRGHGLRRRGRAKRPDRRGGRWAARDREVAVGGTARTAIVRYMGQCGAGAPTSRS